MNLNETKMYQTGQKSNNNEMPSMMQIKMYYVKIKILYL